MSQTKLIETGNSTKDYYQSINKSYRKAFSKLLMLHYPFFKDYGETLESRQINLTDHCVSKIASLEDKHVLEVGCGNGTQSIYIHENFKPASMKGVDINSNNIELANSINGSHDNLEFIVDDAQQLENIPDNSVDTLLCIESAFHYPDKDRFMQQVHRVLKADGQFLIADILSRSYKNRYFLERWKRKMSYHHWTEDHYMETFRKNNLQVDYTENITDDIKKGYTGYGKWIERSNFKSLVDFLWFKLFVFIQVKVNMVLLNKRREYFIFVGHPLKK
jgi:ubiquinone/menaquinone biosynthesis C-methylase UbiE